LKGALLEVRCDQPRQASLILRSAELGTVALFGDRIHVLLEDAERGRTAIEQRLSDAGIPCHELRVIEPTLEDVFTSAIPEASHG
jgi:ABC-2 type transport system ATP-binding protein